MIKAQKLHGLFGMFAAFVLGTTAGLANPVGFTADIALPRAAENLRDLRQLDISIEGVSKGVAHAWLDEREEAVLKTRGFIVTRKPDGAALRGGADAYHTPEKCVADFTEWAAAHKDVCRLTTIGQSVQGRPILGLKVTTDPDSHGFKPLVRVCGAHHGNEVMSCETVILFTKWLLDHYQSDAHLAKLVAERELWIIPMVNPDGVAQRTRYNANGTDLNRNYGYNFAGGGKAGLAPYSEPEVRAVRGNAMANPFSVSLSFHCQGDIINYPWNYTGVRSPDQDLFVEMSNGYQHFNNYSVTEGWDWYETHGDTDDFSYGCRGDLDWTIEVANPAASGIAPVFEKNRDAIVYMIDQAGRGVGGVVTDSVTGKPLEAMVEPLPTGWPCFTHATGGDFHRVLQPGTYKLRVWAPGHREKIVDSVTVGAGTAARVDVALEPEPGVYHALGVVTTVIPNDDDYRNKTHAPCALGAADGRFVSLGKGGRIVLDLGLSFPAGSNAQLTVHDAPGADNTAENFSVATSGSMDGPFSDLGSGAGTATISAHNVQRYLQVTDKGEGRAHRPPGPNDPTTTPGLDLDAVTVIVDQPHSGPRVDLHSGRAGS